MYTNRANVSLPMAIWLASDDYLYAETSNEISTTLLMRSPRYIIATRRAMYPEEFKPSLLVPDEIAAVLNAGDIQERIPSRMGTAIHSAVEAAVKTKFKSGLKLLGYPGSFSDKVLINPEPNELTEDSFPIYTEQRLYKEIDCFVVSGQFDAVVNGELHDIKTTSTYAYTSGCNDRKYILQGSIYRWLNPELITGDDIIVDFLFTDWQKFSTSNPDYPPYKVMGKRFPLMSLEDTDGYIRNKIKQLKKYWEYPLHEIPCCSPDDLFTSPPVYKYYRNGYEEGKRSTKNFSDMGSATYYKATHGNNQGTIMVDRGKPFYCPVCDVHLPDSIIPYQPTDPLLIG